MVFTISEVVTKDFQNAILWRELLIAFIASIPFFTYGIESTALTSTSHSGHFISTEEVPWSTTAFVLGAGIAAPLFCCMIDQFGRKIGIFFVSLVQGASLIPLFFLNETNTIILHVFAGVSSGGLFTVIPTYIREISSPKTRGYTLTLMMAMTTAGYTMKLVMNLEEMMYLMAALFGIQILLMILIIESSSYYVMKENIEEASKSIATIRGLFVNDQNVINELTELKNESERAIANGKLSPCSIYRNKIWWDSTKIGLIMYTCIVLCGSIVFMDQQKTLMQLKLNSDPHNQLVLISLLAGSVCTMMTSVFVDRKYILTVGHVTMALASGVLAVYTQVDLTVTSARWVPVASLAILVFGYGLAWGLPIVILVEILNFKIRASLLGFIAMYAEILKLVHVHTFQYIEDYVGIYAMFYIFACMNLYGAVYCLFVVPEIKMKTLRQVEKQIKRTPLPA